MVRKKLDERIRTLIERGVVRNERSVLVLVGDHGKDQVPNIHQLLSRTSVRARPDVLWCYKKELGFSTHRMKVSTEFYNIFYQFESNSRCYFIYFPSFNFIPQTQTIIFTTTIICKISHHVKPTFNTK